MIMKLNANVVTLLSPVKSVYGFACAPQKKFVALNSGDSVFLTKF